MNGKVVVLLLVALCCVLFCQVSAAPKAQCMLSTDPGPCRAMMIRYAYNPETNKCEEFMYGGCHGNANNFKTMDVCSDTCS